MFERCANRLGRNFIERHTENLFRIGRRNFFFRLSLILLFNFRRGLGTFLLPTRRAGFLFHKFGRPGKHHRQMRGDSLPFAVRVARQIDRVGGIRRFAQVVDDLELAVDDLQRRLENLHVVESHRLAYRLDLQFLAALFRANFFLWRAVSLIGLVGQTNTDRLFRQVQYVTDRSFDDVVLTQILVDSLRLCGRFDNDERTSHSAVLTPYPFAGRHCGEACALLANLHEDARSGANVSRRVSQFR